MQGWAASSRTFDRQADSRSLHLAKNNPARQRSRLALTLYECRLCLRRGRRQQPAHKQCMIMKNNSIRQRGLVVPGYPFAFAAPWVSETMGRPCEHL
jgi:hypothetical protein